MSLNRYVVAILIGFISATLTVAAWASTVRLTPDAPKVMTPIAYRYEFCFVRPGTAKAYLLTDTGIQERTSPSTTDWATVTATLGNEGWDLVGPGPIDSGKGEQVLWFKRGRRE